MSINVPFQWQTVRTAVKFLHIFHGYLLMLLAMTFSVGIFFSVISGLCLGFFVFHRRIVIRRPTPLSTAIGDNSSEDSMVLGVNGDNVGADFEIGVNCH